uniref:Uncharacterized protein n=1 Tax=Rhizophora mucronata TaxID=61149 RepID=A0A2P2JCB8_RHIMU
MDHILISSTPLHVQAHWAETINKAKTLIACRNLQLNVRS